MNFCYKRMKAALENDVFGKRPLIRLHFEMIYGCKHANPIWRKILYSGKKGNLPGIFNSGLENHVRGKWGRPHWVRGLLLELEFYEWFRGRAPFGLLSSRFGNCAQISFKFSITLLWELCFKNWVRKMYVGWGSD